MSLDETKGWKYVGSETTCKTDDKTKDETKNKQNEKNNLGPVISTKNRIVTPIMTTIPMAQTQVVADKAKEYGMNKPMPFTGDQTKIRQFLQDCLGYLDINQGIYNSD
jgi:hypothetical protein